MLLWGCLFDWVGCFCVGVVEAAAGGRLSRKGFESGMLGLLGEGMGPFAKHVYSTDLRQHDDSQQWSWAVGLGVVSCYGRDNLERMDDWKTNQIRGDSVQIVQEQYSLDDHG